VRASLIALGLIGTSLATACVGSESVANTVPADRGGDGAMVADAGSKPEAAAESGGSGSSSGDSSPGSSSGSSSGCSSSSSSSGSSSGPSGPCDGAPLVTHQDGVGQTWTDCIPMGTYNSLQATKACVAYCTANTCDGGLSYCIPGGSLSTCDDTLQVVTAFNTVTNEYVAWSWTAPYDGSLFEVPKGQDSCLPTGTWN
jgi:hypothetical protein